jgi:hypothetical protein
MPRISQTQDGQLDQVYVIFRVFNLGRDDIGVRVLVDPEAMRQENQLLFTSETWSVRPRLEG